MPARLRRACVFSPISSAVRRNASRSFSCGCCLVSCGRARWKVCCARPLRKPPASVPALVRQAAMMCGDLGEVARAALVEGCRRCLRYSIQLFRPVEPMLASPAESVAEALEAFGEAAFELKLDGARIQVHKSGDEVSVFSRALRDVTAAVPEVVEAVAPLPAREIILDGEVLALQAGRHAVAVSGNDAPVRPAARRRSARIGAAADAVLLRLPVRRRPAAHSRAAARAVCGRSSTSRATLAVPHRIIGDAQMPRPSSSSAPSAAATKGVMAKALDAPYAAGSRGSAWLKIKNVRTLDLVVLAAEWGSGQPARVAEQSPPWRARSQRATGSSCSARHSRG